MSDAQGVIRHTVSVCPVCLRRIPAVQRRHDGAVWLEKQCPQHGFFSTPIWRDKLDLELWRAGVKPLMEGENPHCPHGCGICPDHKQGTCCALLEVTPRCNLACQFCFADDEMPEPDLGQLRAAIDHIASAGRPTLQLSGGEPSLRDDLPELVAYAKQQGCSYVQLNSNGLRLAEDEEYVAALAEAGLDFVFMQFDGTDDGVYQQLRGRPLLTEKLRAVEHCDAHHIGVTFVPTVVRGVNTAQLGDILRLAVSLSPAVRGVHFQPVSFLGRYPAAPAALDRYTLDELLTDLVAQSGGRIELANFRSSCCDHPLCGFHGGFIVLEDGSLLPLTQPQQTCCCGSDQPPQPVQSCCGGSERAPQSALQEGCCCGSGKTAWQSDNCCSGQLEATQQQSCCAGEEVQVLPCACDEISRTTAAQNREYIGRRWQRNLQAEQESNGQDISSLSGFLTRARSHAFTISAMAFQDAWNLDIERLRQCSLHVYADGMLKPFCSHYLTAAEAAHD